MINEEEARKELSNLSNNAKKYLADKIGNQIVSIKLTNELSSLDPTKKKKNISHAISKISREVNRIDLFQ